ncbi:MAG: zinc ribbon domain-containing protein [Nitrospirae bacterium]|nr:zinc ribbon domain-containing protein [Nitrospirota bacterium]
MPIYEYRCPSCSHQFEYLQKITDAKSVKCPKCGTRSRRQISNTSFILKGSGWYKTDYASKESKRQRESDSGSTDSGKTESKTKSEPKSQASTPSTGSSSTADSSR